jgi:hypothetical protein
MKKYLLITIATLALTIAEKQTFAQSPEWVYAKSAGGTNDDLAFGISTDAWGNVYVTGSFQSSSITFGSTVLTNAGYANIFITKYDSNGTVLWAKSAGGTEVAYGNNVSTDAAGNVYVTGSFSSSSITFDSTVLTNAGNYADYDIFITKYDSNGNVLWAKSAGGIDSDNALGISTDASGNVYLTGYFESYSITFGSTVLTGYHDIFITKYDSNGTVLWAKSAGGGLDDLASGVSTDASGNVYVTGSFESPSITFGSTVLTNTNEVYNSPDIFITKYDSNGTVLWAKSAGGTDADAAFSISTDGVGNVYVTGWFQSYSITLGSTVLTNAGYYDIFITKYDSNGSVLWGKNAGGTGYDGANSVSTDAGGNVYVTGSFGSDSITVGSTTLTNAGGGWADIFITKYDSTGTVLWAKSVGGTTSDNATSTSTDALGNVYITGGFSSPSITFGSTVLTNATAGYADFFIGKLSSTVTTDIDENHFSEGIKVFPNPFSSQAILQTGNLLHNATLTMDNVYGQTVKQITNINGQTIVLSRDNLLSGLYFLRLTEDNKTIATKKLVITD